MGLPSSLHYVLELLRLVKLLGTAVYFTKYWQLKFTQVKGVCLCAPMYVYVCVLFRLIDEQWTWEEMEDVEDELQNEDEEWEDEEERVWSICRSRVAYLMTGWFLCVWHCYEGVALVFDSPTTLLLSGNKMN